MTLLRTWSEIHHSSLRREDADPPLRVAQPDVVFCLFPQVPQWEGDNQLCRVHGLPPALFPEWHPSCPPPLQSLLLTHGCMTSPTPQLLPTAMTSSGQTPPLPGPVTSITAPFYDASFRCQVCLPTDLGGGWERDRTSGAQALSQPSLPAGVQLDWGSMPTNCRQVQKTFRSESAASDRSVPGCYWRSGNWSCLLWKPPRSSRSIPLAAWATESNKTFFRFFLIFFLTSGICCVLRADCSPHASQADIMILGRVEHLDSTPSSWTENMWKINPLFK